MWVEYGNANAIEGYRDPDSDDPELVRWREVPEAERITKVVFPEGMTLQEAFNDAVISINFNFAEREVEDPDHPDGVRTERHKPVWVESDSEGLKALLTEHFGLKQGHKRPARWGREFGLHKDPALSLSHPANAGHTATDEKAVALHREGGLPDDDDDDAQTISEDDVATLPEGEK